MKWIFNIRPCGRVFGRLTLRRVTELESASERFRVPKTSFQETVKVNDAIPASTKYENKWAVSIFAEWQRLREVKVPVLDCGGLFKDYTIYTRLPPWAQISPELTVCRWNIGCQNSW